MFENYVFDLYGTLVDIHTEEEDPCLWEKLSLYMTLQGAPYSSEELKRIFRQSIREEQQKNYRTALSQTPSISINEIEVDFDLIISALYARKQMQAEEGIIRQWAILFRTLSLKKLSLFPETLETLTQLKKRRKKIFLLSNAQRRFTEPEMRALGIYELFDDIFYSSDVGFTKPSALFYQALLKKHSLCPKNSVMVGNDDQADCHGAHNMGLASFYIQTQQSPVLSEPLPSDCRQIRSLLEILPEE